MTDVEENIANLSHGMRRMRCCSWLKDGDEPMVLPLFTVDFWVLFHDLHGFMPEMVAKQLGNFIGVFLEYDVKVVSLGYKGIVQKYDFKLGLDISLQAPTRRAMAPKSVWLKEENSFGSPNYGVTNTGILEIKGMMHARNHLMITSTIGCSIVLT
ncbi:hypothetical protein Goarm_018546, partial [Gossypium armourianum]|nr:hypothetical protein [Gossypium armourianum]